MQISGVPYMSGKKKPTKMVWRAVIPAIEDWNGSGFKRDTLLAVAFRHPGMTLGAIYEFNATDVMSGDAASIISTLINSLKNSEQKSLKPSSQSVGKVTNSRGKNSKKSSRHSKKRSQT